VRYFSAVLLLSVLSVATMAQTPQATQGSSVPVTPAAPSSTMAPTPQQMMGYFAGNWKLSGTQKISPKSPGAPFTATERGEWVPGGYFLETHTVMHGPLGDIHSTRMMEFNPQDNAYTYNAYNSLGEHTMAIGHAEGDTWVWDSEAKLNGVVAKGRYTVTLTSPAAYNFKSEVAQPDGGWATVMEGKATRTQ
jgi:hypothetical protein